MALLSVIRRWHFRAGMPTRRLLNAWYEPKDHSIAVCYEYIEEAIANPRRPIAADAHTVILLPLSGAYPT